MAKIVYALSGEGRGHTSRVMAVSAELRQHGHEVLFCCGGMAREILEARGDSVLPVPALRQVVQGNQLQCVHTLLRNWPSITRQAVIVAHLTDALAAYRPDLLITDFEAFSSKAAQRLGVPVLSFNHQEMVTETRYSLSPRYWFQALMTMAVIRGITPAQRTHTLLTSFFYPAVKRPDRTTLIPPIVRQEVQALTPREGGHVLVYYNQSRGAEHVLQTLRQVNAAFILYNFPRPAHPEDYPNLVFKAPSLQGFLEDLASSRAVVCTAGFTLISEALYLAKPLLVIPNGGLFEQTLNALFLQRSGMGEAVVSRPLKAQDVTGFLSRRKVYRERIRGQQGCGNKAALACIEGALFKNKPKRLLRPPLVERNIGRRFKAVG